MTRPLKIAGVFQFISNQPFLVWQRSKKAHPERPDRMAERDRKKKKVVSSSFGKRKKPIKADRPRRAITILVEPRLALGTDPGSGCHSGLSPVWWAGYIWDDDYTCHGQSVHYRAAWIERNLDDKRRRYLSIDAHHILGGARAVGIDPAALSSRECIAARGLRGCALAGLAEFAGAGRLAGRGVVGASSGAGGIGGMDHRDEEHESGLFFLLSILFFVRWLRARDSTGKPDAVGTMA